MRFELCSDIPGLEIGAYGVIVWDALVHAVDAAVDKVYKVLEVGESVVAYRY
jgi:hypothetical protein